MFIITFLSTVLILSRGKARRIVDGVNVDGSNWDPFLLISKDLYESPNYDITHWVRQLHLQQCAFVEIGEGFCALFVELRSIPSESKVLDSSEVGEFFLGNCPCLTLHTWELCSPELTKLRKTDCTFNEATPYSNTSARVHRRLCDITSLVENASTCDCSIPIAGQGLYKTKGFPTCFLNPLPESLCSPRGVCGIAQCTASTIKGIHTSQCDPNCHQRQPFCEEIGPSTSVPAEINSLWSRWTTPKCNNSCGRGFMVEIASCQDQRKTGHRLYRARIVLVSQRPSSFQDVPSNVSLTMTKGVNFSSCPDTFVKCYCEVNTVDGIMRATRLTEPCISIEGCIASNSGTFTFEGELDPGNSIDLDDVYENDDRERKLEDTLCYSDGTVGRVARRNLLQVQSVEDDYVARENSVVGGKRFKDERGYRSVLRRRLGDEANYRNQDEEDDLEDEDEDGDDEKRVFFAVARPEDDDDDDDDDEDTIGFRESAKGRRVEEAARSDYAAFEGKAEVGELRRNGHVRIRAAADDEECEDEVTEILQYYDYESTGGAKQIGLALELVAFSILFWFLEF